MLVGEYASKITSGNRVAIPAKLRNELRGLLYVTQGYEGCLVLVDEERFKRLTEGVADQPFIRGEVRETTRFLLGSAFEIETDDQGRFVLPVNLRKYAQIKEDAVFLGLGGWIEIWGNRVWQTHKNKLEQQGAKIAEKLVNVRGSQA